MSGSAHANVAVVAPPDSGGAHRTVLLSRASGLDSETVARLIEHAHGGGVSTVRVVSDHAGVDPELFASRLATELGLAFISQDQSPPGDDLVELVPASVATGYFVVPVTKTERGLLMAVADPFDLVAWQELKQLVPGRLVRAVAAPDVIERMLRASYGLGADTVERLTGDASSDETGLEHLTGSTDLSDEAIASEPTVVNLVNRILTDAIELGATDIHFEPFEHRLRVRVRIDGLLEDVPVPASARRLQEAIVSRVKVMARLDITERRLPQDGRARVGLHGGEYDLRVSVLPGIYGEAVNIRIQNRKIVDMRFGGLGFSEAEVDQIQGLVSRSHGLFLVTGPTGSGKTTTLYTCLSHVRRPDTKIITIEDPVEYWVDGILQMQVHESIGFTFSRALRSMLRHDPDVMLIGEIRDRDTADITIRSALTGHLVLATLHTNDAPGAVSRLIDIGVEPFLVASSLTGVLAQRLVRRVCPACAEPREASGLPGVATEMVGRGCEACRGVGYRGRTVVCELMRSTPEVRRLIESRASADAIRECARVEGGMRPLRDAAIEAVRSGRTTVSEALRVTEGDS